MDGSALRAIATIVITVLLAVQALRAIPGSWRRRAFVLAAVAFGLLALINSLLALGIAVGGLMLLALIVFAGLALASVALLAQAWRSGEMNEQLNRARQAMAEERDRRRSAEERRTTNDE